MTTKSSLDKLNGYEINVLKKRLNTRSKKYLLKIFYDDLYYLLSVNITTKQIVDRLERFILEYRETGNNVVNGHYKITEYFSSSATTMCPLYDVLGEKKQYYEMISYNVMDIKTKYSITYNKFLLHLIRDHNFFGLPNTTDRIEPSHVVSTLMMEAGVDYEAKYTKEKYWKQIGYHRYCCQNILDEIENNKLFAIDTFSKDNILVLVLPVDVREEFKINNNEDIWTCYLSAYRDSCNISKQVGTEKRKKILSIIDDYKNGKLPKNLVVKIYCNPYLDRCTEGISLNKTDKKIKISIPKIKFYITKRISLIDGCHTYQIKSKRVYMFT